MKRDSSIFDHKGKRAEHMARRHEQHESLRDTAKEFGVGKSTVHRAITEYKSNNQSDDDD